MKDHTYDPYDSGMNGSQKDATMVARADAEQFFATLQLCDDEAPYYGDIDAALRGCIYGDEYLSAATTLSCLSGDDEWLQAWRDELYRIGRLEMGIEVDPEACEKR